MSLRKFFLLNLADLNSELEKEFFHLFFYGNGDFVIMLDAFDKMSDNCQLKPRQQARNGPMLASYRGR